MANVRAGVAYVDVRLGDISRLKSEILASFAKMGKEIADKLGNEIQKNVPTKQAGVVGNTMGKVTAAEMSKAFFRDSQSSFGAGLRALATGQIRPAIGLFRQAGTAMSLGLRSGFEAGLRGISNIFSRTFNALPGLASKIASSTGRAFSSITGFVRRASDEIDIFSKKMGFLSFQLQNLGFVATAAFTAPVAAIFGFATAIGIMTASQIEQATAALTFLLPKGYDLEALLKRLQKIAQQSPIFDTADLIQFTQTFVAAGVEVGRTERFLRAFSNVALVTGTSTERAELAIRAITQAFGKGKLQAEELTQQLAEAMPAAMKIIREQLGVTQKELVEMVKEGKISGNDLIDIFTKVGESKQFLEGAAAGANTLAGKWQELKETVSTRLGEIFLENADSIKKAIDKAGPLLEGLIKDAKPLFADIADGFLTVVEKVRELVQWYKNLTPEQQKTAKNFALIALAAGPVIVVLGTLGAAVAGIAAGIAAISNPVGLAVLGIIAFGIELAVLWNRADKLREKVKELWDSFYKNVVVPFKGPIKDSINDIKEEWDKLVAQFTSGTDSANQKLAFLKAMFMGAALTIGLVVAVVVGVIQGIVAAIGPLIAGVLSFVNGVIKILSGLINFIVGVFTGDWKRAWEGIKEIWNGLWDAIIGVLYNFGKAIAKFVEGLVKGIVNFFKWLYNVLVGNSIIPDMVNAILGWFRSLIDRGKALWNMLGAYFNLFYGKYVQPMIDRIKSGAARVISFFTDLKNKVVSTITSLGSSLYNAGRNIIEGLVNGIKSMAGNVVDAAKGVVSDAVQGAKNLLGIGSPSKVFMEIGKNTMEGLSIGLDKNAKLPVETMAKTFGDMAPRFAPDYGDRGRPPFEERGSGLGAAIQIENYYAKDDDPYRQAEDWYFIVQSRGAIA